MHTIKLKMEDNIYKNIMFILQNLQLKGLEIEEICEEMRNSDTKKNIKKLFSDKKLNLFQAINDPMQWQKEQRDEW